MEQSADVSSKTPRSGGLVDGMAIALGPGMGLVRRRLLGSDSQVALKGARAREEADRTTARDTVAGSVAPNVFAGVFVDRGRAASASAALDPAAAAAHADYRARLELYRSLGFDVSVTLDRGITATLRAPMTARAAARIAFNLSSEDAVTAAHLAQLAAVNADPAFQSPGGRAVLSAGGTINLASTQRGLETADSALQAAIGALEVQIETARADWPDGAEVSADEALEPYRSLLEAMSAELDAIRDHKTIAAAELSLRAAQLKARRAGSLAEVHDAFEGPSTLRFDPAARDTFLGYVEVRDAAGAANSAAGRIGGLIASTDPEQRAAGKALQVELWRSKIVALQNYGARAAQSGAIDETSAAFEETLELIDALEAASPESAPALDALAAELHEGLARCALEDARRRYSERPPASAFTARDLIAGGAIDRGAANPTNDRYRARVEAEYAAAIALRSKSRGPSATPNAQELQRSKVERALMLAELEQLTGGNRAAQDLRDALRAVLPEHSAAVAALFDARRGGTAKLDPADRAAARTVGAAIGELPPADRALAVELTARLGTTFAEQGRARPASAAAGVLLAAEAAIDPAVDSADHRTAALARTHIESLRARAAASAGDFNAAEAGFQNMRFYAEALPREDPARAALIGQSLLLEAETRAHHATVDRTDPAARLRELDALRAKTDVPRERAAILVMEVNAAVAGGQFAIAEEAYAELHDAAYADLEGVQRVLAKVDAMATPGPIAFAEVALAEWGNSTLVESGLSMGGGMACGAAVGFYFGGPPGAALGALVGGTAGSLSLGAWNLTVRGGLDRAMQAAATGRSPYSATDDALNAVGFALDVAPIASGVRAGKLMGSRALDVMVRGARVTGEAAEWLADASRAVRVEAAALDRALTVEEADRLVQEVLMKKFGREFAAFGSSAQAALGLGAIGGSFGARLLEIEEIADPREKQAALDALAEQAAGTALGLALIIAPSAAIEHFALRSFGQDAELRNQLIETFVDPPKIARIADTDYEALLARRSPQNTESNGFFDPVSGQIYLRASVPEAEVGRVAAHELVHRSFHQLPDSKRAEVVAAFVESPEWNAMRDRLLEDPAYARFSDEQLVDELLSRVLSMPERYPELARLARPALSDPALLRAGLDRAPSIDVDRLLSEGSIAARSQYFRRSLEGDAVASREVFFDPKNPAALDEETTGALTIVIDPNSGSVAAPLSRLQQNGGLAGRSIRVVDLEENVLATVEVDQRVIASETIAAQLAREAPQLDVVARIDVPASERSRAIARAAAAGTPIQIVVRGELSSWSTAIDEAFKKSGDVGFVDEHGATIIRVRGKSSVELGSASTNEHLDEVVRAAQTAGVKALDVLVPRSFRDRAPPESALRASLSSSMDLDIHRANHPLASVTTIDGVRTLSLPGVRGESAARLVDDVLWGRSKNVDAVEMQGYRLDRSADGAWAFVPPKNDPRLTQVPARILLTAELAHRTAASSDPADVAKHRWLWGQAIDHAATRGADIHFSEGDQITRWREDAGWPAVWEEAAEHVGELTRTPAGRADLDRLLGRMMEQSGDMFGAEAYRSFAPWSNALGMVKIAAELDARAATEAIAQLDEIYARQTPGMQIEGAFSWIVYQRRTMDADSVFPVIAELNELDLITDALAARPLEEGLRYRVVSLAEDPRARDAKGDSETSTPDYIVLVEDAETREVQEMVSIDVKSTSWEKTFRSDSEARETLRATVNKALKQTTEHIFLAGTEVPKTGLIALHVRDTRGRDPAEMVRLTGNKLLRNELNQVYPPDALEARLTMQIALRDYGAHPARPPTAVVPPRRETLAGALGGHQTER